MDKSYKKKLGQFFTPVNIATMMQNWINPTYGDCILDPAIGSGNLISHIPESISVTGFDIDTNCLDSVALSRPSTHLHHQDFLYTNCVQQYDSIISNPPYLKYNAYSVPENLVNSIQNDFNLTYQKITNSYIYFVTKCIQLLKNNGKASFLIPTDWLKIKSGQIFKKWILSSGYVRHLIIFNEQTPVFEDNLSTACLLLIEKNKGDLEIRNVDYNHKLTLNEIFNINPIEDDYENPDYVPLSNFVTIRRGIATGNNAWFMQSIKKTKLPHDCLIKCISKAKDINKLSKSFTDNDWINVGGPVLIQPKKEYPECLEYIKKGEQENVHLSYLASQRKDWYHIKLPTPPDYFLNVFTRSEFNFIENLCHAHSLTCYHYVYLKDKTLKNKFEHMVKSKEFHDSVKKVMKVYTGGLMKLEPKMAENIMVPNIKLN